MKICITTGNPIVCNRTTKAILNDYYPEIKVKVFDATVLLNLPIYQNELLNSDVLILGGGGDFYTNQVKNINSSEENVFRSVNLDRDKIETELFNTALNHNIKIVGICRGMQIINVLLGGTLTLCEGHMVRVNDDTKMFHKAHKVWNHHDDEFEVNSRHRWCISDLASNLNITYKSFDGVIEGVESDDGKIIGCQWHAENDLSIENKINKIFWEKICN